MIKIKFCENNFTHGTEDVVNRLKEELKAAEITVESCLDNCDECAEKPFAQINGEFISAETCDDLYDKIMDEI